MTKGFYYLFIIFIIAPWCTHAQTPVIQKIEPGIAYPKSTIVITGSGFSTNPSQLQVWFDQVKGTVLSSTTLSIDVEVPAMARFNNITVINLATRLSAQSSLKFLPDYSGESFDPAKLAPTSIAIPSSSIFSIATADIDGDDKPDILGSRNQTSSTPITTTNLILLLNQSTVGNINFIPASVPNLNINAPTNFVAINDLNGDGKPDLILTRGGNAANNVFVFVNRSTPGTPNFDPPVILQLDQGHFAQEIGVEDLNDDGKPEIVIANNGSNDLYIYRNESSGGNLSINPAPRKIKIEGAPNSFAIELQDIDADGRKDIITSVFQSADLYVLKNLGALNFSTQKIPVPSVSVRDFITSDFNKDGKLDLAITCLFPTGQVQVLLNNSSSSSISFSPPVINPTDPEPFGIDVSDLNGDSFPDFIVAHRSGKKLTAFLHKGNTASVGFDKVSINSSDKSNWYIKAGDLDGDSKPDIAYTSFADASLGPFSLEILRNMNCHLPEILNEQPLTICPSQTIKLKTIPIAGHTFEWSNGFSTIKNNEEPFVEVTVAATYTVKATSSDGCSVISAPVTIASGAGSVPANPVITNTSPVCSDTNFTLSTTPVSGASYIWKGPTEAALPNSASISLPGSIANAGVYSLTIKLGDCSSNPTTTHVDVVSLSNFAISSSVASNTICEGQSLTLTVNSVPGYSYQWIKDGVNLEGKTATTLLVTQSGSYKVNVVNSSLGCSKETNAITVEVLALPVADFIAPATECIGNTITFTNTSTPASASMVYSWDFGDNTTSTVKDPTHTYSAAQTFAPKLTVSYSGITTGCSNSITKNVTIFTATVPEITPSVTEICPDSETAVLTVAGTFTSYVWNTGATTASIDVTTAGDYSVETVDPNGCKGSSVTVTINEKASDVCEPPPPPTLTFPIVFTPNGDSQNDRWVINGIETKGACTMNIFDGRGRRILQVTGYPMEGWDGSFDGKEVPQGTYFYVFSCPDEPPVTGSVLVVR